MSFRKFLNLIGIVLVVAAVAISTACNRSKGAPNTNAAGDCAGGNRSLDDGGRAAAVAALF